MLQRYLPPTLLLIAGLTLLLLSGARHFFQSRTNQVAGFVVTNTPLVATLAPTRTPLYAPTRTPVLSTSLPVTPSPTVTPVPLVTPTDTPSATTEIVVTETPIPTGTAPPTETLLSTVVVVTQTPLPTDETEAQQVTATLVGEGETVEMTVTPLPTSTFASTATATPIATNTPSPTNTPQPTNTPMPTNTVQAIDPNFSITYRERFGVSGSIKDAPRARSAGLNYGSFISWTTFDTSQLSADVTPWQMVRVSQAGIIGGLEPLGVAVRANPGGYFVIGNEPDVGVQDNTTAPRYAEIYHDAYYYIKSIDPTAQVAIAGVASPTPLRRFYLELVLNHYEQTYGEKMPIDIWTIHVYVLREERDSWGIGIPTGLGGTDQGMLYEIDDHKNADIANQLLTDFRWWLSEKGYRDTPLAITEFGILLPADYGFPPEVVSNYMTTLVNYYLNAAGGTGYPSDGNKLVQWWFWFSIVDHDQFEVSNMLDSAGQLTPVGRTYAGYIP